MRLTKSVIDKIQTPCDRDQVFYRDGELKGFAVRITSNGIKSFVVEKLVNRKVRRITLGRYGELTAEQARKEAQKLLGKIATGVDPVADKRLAKAKAVTLSGVFADYKQARKNLKPKTLYDYEQVMARAFADWKSKPLFAISKDQVAKKHRELGKNGEAYANLAMRVLRALFNFAIEQYEDAQGKPLITENPVKRLSKTRAWYRVKRRKTYITPDQLSMWHQAVMQLDNAVMRDYLLLILLTGVRRNEAAQLKKEDVNLKAKWLTITDPKNHEPHTLPLTIYLHDLLKRRIDVSCNEYVFPSSGEGGYLVEPRKQMAKIIEKTGIQFTVHDLRRTFITIAESLDIPAYALKRLLNHKMDSSDVTAGYIITDVERLRRPMQQIEAYILEKCLDKL
jgi:integrase